MEAYVAPGDRTERKPNEDDRAYYHLVLLARDPEGYRNLVKLTSIGYREGFYRKPRVDREVLERYSDGVIVTSACMAGEVARHLLADRMDEAREAAAWYADVFDDRYYLEVQGHDTSGQGKLNERVFALADDMGLPVVATNDAHFLRARDHDAHDVLLCIGLGKDREDERRMRYDAGLYFKDPDEMAARFPDRPKVIENTLAIADSVDLELEQTYHVPSFPLPEETDTEAELLRTLTFEGAERRYGDRVPDHVRERIEYELGVISNDKADYAGYFLITQDFINWAKAEGIPVGPGRGSAAGSIVSYCLGITDVDPLRFDLLFERFLNPARVSMPDIDIDFCYERRGAVIDYVRRKYGEESVGQIITFGTMKSRAVIRDVGRALGFEPSETDKLAKMIPYAPGVSMTVSEALKRVGELRELYQNDERVHRLIDYAEVLEGLARHASVHAAGIVIAPGPLDDYVPVCVQNGRGAGSGRNGGGSGGNDTGNGANGDGVLVTQWDMTALEEAGMLKMDFLGLKTLTIIREAVDAIRRRHGTLRHPESGEEYEDIEAVPLDDAGVYEMLAGGATSGVFQFESSLATDKLRAMRCDRFEDLIATNALIRPGPLDSGMTDVYVRRKTGREDVSYPHPSLKDVLEPTYGVITYQEQVMRIAQVLAGFSLAEADVLRKAVGKKDAELIGRELERFVEKAVENGVGRKVARTISEQIETFGRYGFNRSHSVAYALLSYRTAWLKRYYPAEFMAAMLSAVLDNTDNVVKYINECRDLAQYLEARPDGIAVLPPDVNESEWKFTPVDDDRIRFGLGAIRGLGEAASRSILDAREADGPFVSLFDLAERTDSRTVGRRAVEALIQAGACDSLIGASVEAGAGGSRPDSGPVNRARLMAGLDTALGEAQLREKERSAGQASLFGNAEGDAGTRPPPQLPDAEPWPESERLAREKEALGFFISGHPLDKYRDEVRLYGRVTTANLVEHRDRKVELACVITEVNSKVSRRGSSRYGRITVEDYHGTATILAFGDVWEENKERLQPDEAVLLRGGVSGRERDEDDPPIFLDEVVPLATLRTSGQLGLELNVAGGGTGEDVIRMATRVLREHSGPAPVFVRWTAEDSASGSRILTAKSAKSAKNGSGNGNGVGDGDGSASSAHAAQSAMNGSAGETPGDSGDGESVTLRSRSLKVAPSTALLESLREILGSDRVRLVKARE